MSFSPMWIERSRPRRRDGGRGQSGSLAILARGLFAVGVIGLVLSLGGCGDQTDNIPSFDSGPEYEGRSREQIEAEAAPMTPEEAESLGIVDTTIRMQPPMDPDSVIPLGTILPQ